MSITVRTSEGDAETYPNADAFTVNFDSGTLAVKRTDPDGNPLAIYAVYASGAWAAVFNDDAAAVTE